MRSAKFLSFALAILLMNTLLDAKKPKDPKDKVIQKKVIYVEQPIDSTEELRQELNQQHHQHQAKPCEPQQPVFKRKPPKSLKVATEYEQCKQECKRQRDHLDANAYIEQLKEELKIAEQQLQQQQNEQMAQMPQQVDPFGQKL